MRLKKGFITQNLDGVQVMVATGPAQFSGIVRSNRTAAVIVDMLKQSVSEQEIISAMTARYDAPESLIASDVRSILDSLRSIDALEE